MGQRERDWKQQINGLDAAALLDRWRNAIEEIGEQIVEIRFRRRIFAELDDELVRHNQGQGTSLVVDRWLRPMYGDAQLAALRRITVDDDVRSISLTVLLEEIKLRPEVVSQQNYSDAVAALPVNVKLTDSDRDDIFGPGNDHLPPDVIDGYLADIADDYNRVKVFVDKHVAHSDRGGVDPITWGELDDALDDLEEHLNRIHVPLTGTHLSTDLAVRTDWRQAFRGLAPNQRQRPFRPTNQQLNDGARSIAYRSAQLAAIAAMVGHQSHTTIDPPTPGFNVEAAIDNASVESALINARSLLGFFAPDRPNDVGARDYFARCGLDWPPAHLADLAQLAAQPEVRAPISKHLAHATYKAALGPDNESAGPGEWPLRELAVALVAGVAETVAALDDLWAAAFAPASPIDALAALTESLDLAFIDDDSEPDATADIVALTHTLRRYLRARAIIGGRSISA